MAMFVYYWKSSNKDRHEGEIEAPDRETAFSILRERGIRAIKVEPKGWTTGEGYGGGIRKRWVFLIALSAAAIAAVCAILLKNGGGEGSRRRTSANTGDGVVSGVIESPAVEVRTGRRVATARPRKQLGLSEDDVVKLAKKVFRHDGEVLLARFAQPGLSIHQRIAVNASLEEDLYDALDDRIVIEQDDDKATVDLKRIVTGLKEEMAKYISSGRTAKGVVEYFSQRQSMEADFRKNAIAGFDSSAEDAVDRREEINAKLQAMDLELIDAKP